MSSKIANKSILFFFFKKNLLDCFITTVPHYMRFVVVVPEKGSTQATRAVQLHRGATARAATHAPHTPRKRPRRSATRPFGPRTHPGASRHRGGRSGAGGETQGAGEGGGETRARRVRGCAGCPRAPGASPWPQSSSGSGGAQRGKPGGSAGPMSWRDMAGRTPRRAPERSSHPAPSVPHFRRCWMTQRHPSVKGLTRG